jgi:hypothetical protein
LSLVEGMLRGDAAADRLVIDTFDDLEQAARAHAHLSGFLLEVLVEQRHQAPDAAARFIRSLLDQ